MELSNVIKVIGWSFSVTPLVIFVGVGVFMIKGAMKDDELIRSLVMICSAFFFIGVIMLLLIYLTNIIV